MRHEPKDTHAGRRRRAGGGSRRRLITSALLLAGAIAGALPAGAAAAAAPRPSATTGGAISVSYASATLKGSVDPQGLATSYYFQYGPTRSYGSQSAIASAGAGRRAVPVAQAITGLQPLTTYHYRLVAVGPGGSHDGADRTFTTTKVPLSLAILSAPNPVPYGAPIVIQGTLSGTDDANRPVVLQSNPFPFTQGFANVGNPGLTEADGHFSFTVLGTGLTTQFRVVTQTSPAAISPTTTENVSVRVASHIGRAKRHGFVRVYGTVTPAETGMKVEILRTIKGHGVRVGGAVLKAHGTTASAFSSTVRAHRGVYRVLVQVTGGAQIPTLGVPLLVG